MVQSDISETNLQAVIRTLALKFVLFRFTRVRDIVGQVAFWDLKQRIDSTVDLRGRSGMTVTFHVMICR
jgi:hypothetical protein